MSEKQQAKPRKSNRSRRMNPIRKVQLTMFASIAAAVILVGGLLIFDSFRSEKKEKINNSPLELTTVQEFITHGDVTQRLEKIKELNGTRANSITLVTAGLKDKIKLYESISNDSEELTEDLRYEKIRGHFDALITLQILHLNNGVDDIETKTKIIEMKEQFKKSTDPEIQRLGELGTVCISFFNAMLNTNEETLLNTEKSLDELIQAYPQDQDTLGAAYKVLIQISTGHSQLKTTSQIADKLNDHCLKHKELEDLAHVFTARRLLIQHQLLDIRGKRVISKSKGVELTRRYKELFAEKPHMCLYLAKHIEMTLNELELNNENSSAFTINNLFAESLENEDESNAQIRQHHIRVLARKKRLGAVGEKLDWLPNHKGEISVVLVGTDNMLTLQSINAIKRYQFISPDRVLQLYAVSLNDENPILNEYRSLSGSMEFELIADPEKRSAFMQTYPVSFTPAAIILDENRVIRYVNINLSELEGLTRKLLN